jgi:succinate-semialdehyde dehydrogenase/glutarate-semialdehyde dehydrogenase
VNINEGFAASFGSLDSPMGGMRDSGTGRRQGLEGVRRYTEAQTVAVQRGFPLVAPSFMSGATYANVTTATLRLMKRLGRP